MRTILVLNIKGGVAKTTTACNLAYELARAGDHVLLCDADKQGNASRWAGLKDPTTPAALGEVLAGQKQICEVNLWSGHDRLNVMPSNQSLFAASESLREDTTLPAWQTRLATAFADYSGDYLCDWVVVDCPPDLDYSIAAALLAADLVIIPVTPDADALDGLADTLEQVSSARAANHKLRAMGLWVRVPNTWQPPESFNIPAVLWFKTSIRESPPVSRAKNAAKPIRLESPGCYAARDYRALAAEIKEVLPNE